MYPITTILLINAVLALIVLILAFHQPLKNRHTYFLFAWFFLICPLVGPVFLGTGLMAAHFFRPWQLNLTDITFSKQREKTQLLPDERVELNYTPLEDAMAIADSKKVRNLLMDILKNSSITAYSSVVRAIEDRDTEVSHYAATAVLDILSEFRINSQDFLARMRRYPENVEHNIFILEYFYRALEMQIMNEAEQEKNIHFMHEVAENLFHHNLWYMKAEHYLWVSNYLLKIEDLQLARKWVQRAKLYVPDELSTYKARLRLAYAQKDQMGFFTTLEELKNSDIVVDKEILDLFRLYD